MDRSLRLALILGSTREGRLCDTIAAWAGERIEQHGGFSLHIVDPATAERPTRHDTHDAALDTLHRQLAHADAFVVVTPEYNHGYTAALKQLIDSTSDPWQAKPVGFVSYGGVSGGLRAVEQLRQVFAELHTVTVRNTVSFANVWSQFDADGRLHEPARPNRSMAAMLAQLQWWAAALREARGVAPYGEIAA